MAHGGEDGRQEDGEGGVRHVGEEEDGRREPGHRVAEDGEDVPGVEAGGGVALMGFLLTETEAGDFLLALGQVGGCLRGVGDDVPR